MSVNKHKVEHTISLTDVRTVGFSEKKWPTIDIQLTFKCRQRYWTMFIVSLVNAIISNVPIFVKTYFCETIITDNDSDCISVLNVQNIFWHKNRIIVFPFDENVN
jgi:hypothetical protein